MATAVTLERQNDFGECMNVLVSRALTAARRSGAWFRADDQRITVRSVSSDNSWNTFPFLKTTTARAPSKNVDKPRWGGLTSAAFYDSQPGLTASCELPRSEMYSSSSLNNPCLSDRTALQRKAHHSMRLTLRLLALTLLIVMAAFTNLLTPTTYASPCENGCWNGYQTCMGNGNPPNQSQCSTAYDNCMRGCRPPLLEAPVE